MKSRRHRKRVQDLLERATVDSLKRRWPNFEPVLAGLAELLGEEGSAGTTPKKPKKEKAEAPKPADPPAVQSVKKNLPKDEARPLVAEIPPPDKAKPGQVIAVRIPGRVHEHAPGKILTLKIPSK